MYHDISCHTGYAILLLEGCEIMLFYTASIKYRFGSGKATTSTSVVASQIKGKSESSILAYLKEKHKSIKNLEILIESIDWK